VEDIGTGIDPEHIPHLFEPFFTTKGPGRGTGLGLATVQAIVSRNRGAVTVQSRLGEGTRFEVYLPIAQRPPQPEAQHARSLPQQSSGRLLVVEDDELLRDLATEVLEAEGYSVTAAATPDEALLSARSAGSIDLLLTDVVMPGMTGVELATRLGGRHPGLRVLFMSGYTDAHLAARGQPIDADLIRKPFNASALASKVAEMLRRT
jgi:CheY-like chemotaxis protein